jgi:histidinol-phosphate aminotransferase
MSKCAKHIRSAISQINKYVPGKSIEEVAAQYGCTPKNILKLGSNENQLGPSREAIEAIKYISKSVHLYPDIDSILLESELSRYTGLPINNLVVSGCGMDGVIDTLMRLFMREGKKGIIPAPTFSYYKVATLANGGTPVFIPRRDDFSIKVDSIIEAAVDASMIFLCSPNNPTGNQIPEKDLRRILKSVDSVVFLDEAYVEFADASFIHLVREYDNLVVGRTFSKAFGLAGLRLGYAAMPEEIQREYRNVATPFSVSKVAEYAGVAALKDTEHLKKSIEMVKKGRRQLSTQLNLRTYKTEANFILINTYPHPASDVAVKLLGDGIIVRDCTSFQGAGKYLVRITIGTEEQNQSVINALNKIV